MAALITIGQAQARVRSATRRLPEEQIPVADGLDRVLTREVAACGDVPPFPSAAMDGYAALPGDAERAFRVIGEARAGSPFTGRLADGEAVRISTGAAVPDGTAVIRQEDVSEDGDRVRAHVALPADGNLRARGSDMRAGSAVLPAGSLLGPGELAAAVTAGVASLNVTRRPRVAVFCTGDELRAPGDPLGPGQIHNSNGPMLAALAQRCGADGVTVRRLRDDRVATEEALAGAASTTDVVVISGGVSVGPHDHVKPALAGLGAEERFWGVAMQPGKPTWFGTVADTLVFGLPGNPGSALVAFSLFAWPAFMALRGLVEDTGLPAEAELTVPVRQKPERAQVLLVTLERRGSDVLRARPSARRQSHIVSSLIGADALALVPAGEGELAAGARVELKELVR